MAEVMLEVCVDNVDGLAAAIAGGADRIELCSALEIGGLTPSAGLMRVAAASTVPVYAMIRPRGGEFIFDDVEVQLMLNEIDAVASAGLQGVVLGVSRRDGRLDQQTLERLIRRAREHALPATLHRAIDLGFERILTSGGAKSALQGMDGLQRCFDAAAGRIVIMPGAGINAENIAQLRARLPLQEVHASCSAPSPASGAPALAFGFDSGNRRQTSRARVSALKDALL